MSSNNIRSNSSILQPTSQGSRNYIPDNSISTAKLQNAAVTTDKVSDNSYSWVSGKSYVVGQEVLKDGYKIRCLVAHTSATYSTDVSLGYWQMAYPMKNYILNSNFDIWQRGGSNTLVSTGGYTSDRFLVSSGSGGTCTVSRQQFALPISTLGGNTPTYYHRIQQTVGGTGPFVDQRIEDVRTLAGKTITFSFYAWVSSGSISAYAQAIQYFGTGGSPSSSIGVSSSTFNITTTVQKFNITLSIPALASPTLGTNNDHSLIIRINTPSATTFTLDTWGWMVNEGPTSAPFQTAGDTIADELQLCQRYCHVISAQALPVMHRTSGENSWTLVGYKLPTTLRAAPSVSLLSGTVSDVNSIFNYTAWAAATYSGTLSIGSSGLTQDSIGEISFNFATSAPGATAALGSMTINSNIKIAVSAEL